MIERWQIPELDEAIRHADQDAWVAGYRAAVRDEARRVGQGRRPEQTRDSERVVTVCLVVLMALVVVAMVWQ